MNIPKIAMLLLWFALVQALSNNGSGRTKRRSFERTKAAKELVQRLKHADHPREVASLLKGKEDLMNPFVVSSAEIKFKFRYSAT